MSIYTYNQICLGFKLKETSRLGPRPEKPIEIYEFERYILVFTFDLKTGFCQVGPSLHSNWFKFYKRLFFMILFLKLTGCFYCSWMTGRTKLSVVLFAER